MGGGAARGEVDFKEASRLCKKKKMNKIGGVKVMNFKVVSNKHAPHPHTQQKRGSVR